MAKAGSSQPQTSNTVDLSRQAKTVLRNRFETEWTTPNRGFRPDRDALCQLDRNQQAVTFRLRTGHTFLKNEIIKYPVCCILYPVWWSASAHGPKRIGPKRIGPKRIGRKRPSEAGAAAGIQVCTQTDGRGGKAVGVNGLVLECTVPGARIGC